VRRPLHKGKLLTETILNDASLIDMQLLEKPQLSEEGEMQVLRREIDRILTRVYSNTPAGYGKTIDSLREVVRSGQ